MHQSQPDFSRLITAADFYFVRHGQSVANQLGRIAGVEDTPLTDEGREQARRTGEWFREKGPCTVYASPLSRARETAEILARGAGFPAPIEDVRIQELDTGLFSGMTFDEISSKYPRAYASFRAESWEAVPNAEKTDSLRERAVSYWSFLIERANSGERAIVSVTHGGLMQWIIKVTLGSTSWIPVFPGNNCGIFHFRAHPVPAPNPAEAPAYFAEWRLMNFRAF